MQTDFVTKSRRKIPPSLKKNRDFHGDGGLSSQNFISARICRTDNIFIGRQFLDRENAPARKANPSFSRRYLDPKYSRWMSCDPKVAEYMDGKDADSTSGGIYSLANFNLYHYGQNNPIKYCDPTGLDDDLPKTATPEQKKAAQEMGADFGKFVSELSDSPAGSHGAENQSGDGLDKEQNSPQNQLQAPQTPTQSETKEPNSFQTWLDKPNGAPLTDKEASVQKTWATGQMVISPIAGSALSQLDPAAFLAGMYGMADGAIMMHDAFDGKKHSPGSSIPDFVLPYVKTPDGKVVPIFH